MATIVKLEKLEKVTFGQNSKRIPWMSDFGELVTAKDNREVILLRMFEYMHLQQRIPPASRDKTGSLVEALKANEPMPKLLEHLAEVEKSLDVDDKGAPEWRKRVKVVREVLQRPARQ